MQPTRPGRLWYLIPAAGAVVLIARLVMGMVALFAGIETMPRLSMPGTATVTLAAGDHVLYHELAAGSAELGERDVSVGCRLTGPDGTPVDLANHAGSTSYSLGGHSGQSLFDATIVTAGDHALTCEAPDGGSFVIAVAPALTGLLLGVLAQLGLLMLATVVSGSVIFLLRYRSRPRPIKVRYQPSTR